MDKPAHTAQMPPKNSRFAALKRGFVLLLVSGVSGLLFACSYGLNPITPGERADLLANDHTALFTRQEPVTHPISLFESMARALKYNLSHRVALMEKAVAQRQLDLTPFDLLPQISANVERKVRSNPEASSGYSITDQTASTAFSTSQDQDKSTAKLTTAWNILDFGVSAIQASQDADRVLIANENQRKAVHTLLQDVRSTFWRAAGAQKLEEAIGPVIQQARNALADARQVEQERLRPQLDILRFQKTLLEIVRQLQDLRHQLSLAKTEFAALLNLPPGSDFRLEIPDDPALTIPEIRMTIEEMETLALNNRPDVREALYTSRISRGDVRKAMLRMLPGLEFQAGYNWDSNSFAMNAQWEEASSRIVLNIMNILQGPTAIRLAENREELADVRRLTLHMAVLTQVHLSFRQYLSDQRKLQAVEEIDAVDQRIFKNYNATAHNDAQSRLEYISAAASAIMSRLQLYQAYADAQNAVGRIFVTLGVDLAPKATRLDDIATLTDAMREAVSEWSAGVSSSPLQTVQESLGKSPAANAGAGAHAIPDYFLEPQFAEPLTGTPEEGCSPAKGQSGEKGDDLQPETPDQPRMFGSEGKEESRETVHTPPKEEKLAVIQPPAAPEKKAPAAQSPVAPEGKPNEAKQPPANMSKSDGVKPPTTQVEAAKGVSPPVLEKKGGEEADPKMVAEVQALLQAWATAWSQRNP